ncbi:class I SAM-dependent methyltransferase [Crossiella sp. S99.2]|uniref:class I SAM-dependent methyltransferase n=1 Tax=unclassified Crossiella TaxID=2620835 RepID=UPI0035ABC78B
MNLCHRWLCRSDRWARRVARDIIPWALDGVDLGADVLEIGPGYGATTVALATRTPQLTAVEIDPELARGLRARLGGQVQVIEGDGTAIPLPDNSFTGVGSFTMLHHVPSVALQDRLFAEAFRVLRPGGTFAGIDGVPSLGFRLGHLYDTYVPVNPDTLAPRLRTAGFTDIWLTVVPGRSFRFRARKPLV